MGFVKRGRWKGVKMGTLLIGTCGYSYKEWVGPFFPTGTKEDSFLGYYAGQFPTVELDYTYYRMPTAEQLKRMLDRGGPELTFAIKATDTLTHKVDPAKWQDEAKMYKEAIEPMLKANQLEAILFQFSEYFHYTPDNRRYLDKLLTEFDGIPSVVEFRNNQWGNNRVIEGLKKRNIAYASTDLPDSERLPAVLDVATSKLSYFRLHGRNSEKWWGSNSRDRYDYLYNDSELEGVAKRINLLLSKADRLLVYFNNHAKGQAPQNAMMLKKILEKAGITVGRGKDMSDGKHTAGDSPS
jgi:uncharacterized protein YecE (DUF72 family)